MELNGIANMKLIIEMAASNNKIDETVRKQLDEQLDVLMEYMKMYKNYTTIKWPIKFWHEVREEYHARNKKT